MSLPTWDEQMHARRQNRLPRLDRVETCWRLQAPSGRVWECVLYQVETGPELRVQPEGKEDATAMTQLLRGAEELEPTSEAWRARLLANGFTEVA